MESSEQPPKSKTPGEIKSTEEVKQTDSNDERNEVSVKNSDDSTAQGTTKSSSDGKRNPDSLPLMKGQDDENQSVSEVGSVEDSIQSDDHGLKDAPLSEDKPKEPVSKSETTPGDNSQKSEDKQIDVSKKSEGDISLSEDGPSKEISHSDDKPVKDNSHSDDEPGKDSSHSDGGPVKGTSHSDDEQVKDTAQADDEPVKDTAQAGCEPVEDTAQAGDEPIKDSSHSDDPVKDTPGSDGPVKDTSQPGDEPMKDTSHSDDEPVKDTSQSGDEPMKDTSHSDDEPVKDTSQSGDEPVKDASHPGDDQGKDASQSDSNQGKHISQSDDHEQGKVVSHSEDAPVENNTKSDDKLIKDSLQLEGNPVENISQTEDEPLKDTVQSGDKSSKGTLEDEPAENISQSDDDQAKDTTQSQNNLAKEESDQSVAQKECDTSPHHESLSAVQGSSEDESISASKSDRTRESSKTSSTEVKGADEKNEADSISTECEDAESNSVEKAPREENACDSTTVDKDPLSEEDSIAKNVSTGEEQKSAEDEHGKASDDARTSKPATPAAEAMDVSQVEKNDEHSREADDTVEAMALADVDNDSADDDATMEDEDDPLSSKEKDIGSPMDVGKGADKDGKETDKAVKEKDSDEKKIGDASEAKESSDKDTSEEAQKKPSKQVQDSSSDKSADKNQELSGKEDDDICIIPDEMPQILKEKLSKITSVDVKKESFSEKKMQASPEGEVAKKGGEEGPKEAPKGKGKPKESPVIESSPRPQRQAAKKAETQIKVLAAVERYTAPLEPAVPKLTVVEKPTEANPCQQCGLVTFCKFMMHSKDSLWHFCTEACYKEFQSSPAPMNQVRMPVPLDRSVTLGGSRAQTGSKSDRPFVRTCSECSAGINATDERVLTWETMDFCNEVCLGKYQTALGSHCATCKGAVQSSSMGKYCVRFGYDIKQFCRAYCLEVFKRELKVCSYCQKDISGDQDGFLAPVGDRGQFKDFCTSLCMEKYEQMSSSTVVPSVKYKCDVCNEIGDVFAEVVRESRVHKLCSSPCYAAFKFVNGIIEDTCDMCKKYFDRKDPEKYTIYYDDAPHSFCSKTCMNVYILAKRKIVPCTYCKVKKYNFDLIKKISSNGQVIMMCSLNCLTLHQQSTNALGPRSVKCDTCSTFCMPQYQLNMSDSTVRNFCSHSCVASFQNQFTRAVVAAIGKTSPVPTGAPRRAVVRKSLLTSEADSADKSGDLPIISNVTSLATGTDPPSPAATGPSVIAKVPSADAGKTVHKQHIIVRPPYPPQRQNSGVQVRPITHTKGVTCRPQSCSKETQTDLSEIPAIVPIPVPIYIPAPMCMYSAPFPVPVPFPLPIPVPVFIPTTRNSHKGIMKEMKRIQEKIPADPFEAELVMMAEMVAAGKKSENTSESEDEPPPEETSGTEGNGVKESFSPDAADTSNTFGEDMLQMALNIASALDEPAVDFESAVASSTIVPGSQALTQSEDSDADEPTEQIESKTRSGRKRIVRSSSRSSATATPPTKRSRRVSSSESLPVNPPSDGSITPARSDTEKPDANMCLKYTYGVNAWRQWVLQKNAQLEKAATNNRKLKLFKTDLLQLTADELNYSLCLFVKEVRKPNGSEYAPDTIYYLCLGIQLYLIENGRVDNIFSDPFYEKFTECLDEVAKKFSTLYDDSKFIVTRVEEEHLWESKQLGAHSPHVLLSTLMFFNTKHFNISTVDEHLLLSFSQIMKHWKRNNNPPAGKAAGRNVLLRFYPSQAALDSNSKKKKVYEQSENEDNPLRCPVKLYEFYLSKCPESVKTRNDVFYLLPERSCVPDSPVWYSTMSLGRETMLKMLRRVKMVKEINVAMLK